MSSSLHKGQQAPPFCVQDETGALRSLSDFAGRFLILYFYPKDDTSGCTQEAMEFNQLRQEFEAHHAIIIGISPNSCASHQKFRSKYDLTLTLLADETKEMLQAYGVWKEKKMYGRTYMGVERTTFLIGPEGKILEIWEQVSVPGHARAVLDVVKTFHA